MSKIILIEEDDLKNVMRDVLDEYVEKIIKLKTEIEDRNENELITSIAGIAQLFKCSTVTAQRIKNSIPKHLYSQHLRTFAIPKKLLLEAKMNLKHKKNRYS